MCWQAQPSQASTCQTSTHNTVLPRDWTVQALHTSVAEALTLAGAMPAAAVTPSLNGRTVAAWQAAMLHQQASRLAA
jgi:hypothetical protein